MTASDSSLDVAINPRSGVGPEFEKGDRRLRPSLRQRPAQRGARRDAQPPHATPLAGTSRASKRRERSTTSGTFLERACWHLPQPQNLLAGEWRARRAVVRHVAPDHNLDNVAGLRAVVEAQRRSAVSGSDGLPRAPRAHRRGAVGTGAAHKGGGELHHGLLRRGRLLLGVCSESADVG